ncbi:MAG: hypothetical protein HWN65_00155 [Candidatus Helarchaeota archaeon]|nr:hypothetical protein [Candidatus Helarchaeota archaeon]
MSLKRKALDSLGILKDMFLDFLRLSHGYALGMIFIIGLGFLFELAGWWYLMLLAGGLGGFFMKKNGLLCFVMGFIGIAFVWSCFFIYFMIIGPLFEFTVLIGSIMGSFLSFLETMPNLIIIITIVIGGMLGGLGAMNGTFIAKIIYYKEEPKEGAKLKAKKLPDK